MRKISIFISLLIYSASSVYADKHTISGQIVDKDRGVALTASSIFESKNSKTTTSNDFGFYSFSLPEGDVSIEINHIGYSTSHFEFTLSSDTVIEELFIRYEEEW